MQPQSARTPQNEYLLQSMNALKSQVNQLQKSVTSGANITLLRQKLGHQNSLPFTILQTSVMLESKDTQTELTMKMLEGIDFTRRETAAEAN